MPPRCCTSPSAGWRGERLYVDLIDVNPPLVFVLDLFPALIARLTPIRATGGVDRCACSPGSRFGFVLSWRLLRVVPGTGERDPPLSCSRRCSCS